MLGVKRASQARRRYARDKKKDYRKDPNGTYEQGHGKSLKDFDEFENIIKKDYNLDSDEKVSFMIDKVFYKQNPLREEFL